MYNIDNEQIVINLNCDKKIVICVYFPLFKFQITKFRTIKTKLHVIKVSTHICNSGTF